MVFLETERMRKGHCHNVSLCQTNIGTFSEAEL